MILNPSFPRSQDNYKFRPADEVYVPRLVADDLFSNTERILPLLCGYAFSTEEQARKRHFWFKDSECVVEVVKMTVREFLETHDWTGMNPFETINKLEFRAKYREMHPDL